MSSELQLDVHHLKRQWRLLVNAYEVMTAHRLHNGSLPPGMTKRQITCGLTASKPGSAPGPTLGNEYERTLPLTFTFAVTVYILAQRLNAAELLRLYVDYDLLTEASELAVEYIRATLGAGKEYFGLKVRPVVKSMILKSISDTFGGLLIVTL